MKRIIFMLALILTIGAGCTQKPQQTNEPLILNSERTAQENILDTYVGAWFEISYPSGFTIFEREKSPTTETGYDGVSFISPDDLAEFYIYSPQWSGESIWEKLQPGEMILVDTSTDPENGFKTTTKIAQNTQQNFYRTIEIVEMYDAKYVFGFRYQDDQVYNLYKDKYEEFKGSLVQFAD